MEELNLESVCKKLEKLENDKKYWENRLLSILSLVEPSSKSFDGIVVDGGKRIDKMLKYTDLKQELQIDSTLEYIKKEIDDCLKWIELELKRLGKYTDLKQEVVYYKEILFIKDKWSGRMRHLTWEEVSKKLHYSERALRYAYNEVLEDRKKHSKKKNNKNRVNVQDTKKEA